MGRCLYCMQEIQDGLKNCPHCKAPIPFAPEQPQDLYPGTILRGRYVVGRTLGHGGYGITYMAYDQKLGGVHVIKEYFPRNGGRTASQAITYAPERELEIQRTRDRFLQEAKMMTIASNVPNVVRVTDQFDENGTSYILMDYLQGATLDDWIFKRQRRFTWEGATKIICAALEGLQGLHQRGILHRDISCSNIFLCNDGKVRIIDFGSAEMIKDAQEHPATIQSSVKVPYTSPEQMQGMAQGPQTDVYAMAEVLFKAITRKGDKSLAGVPLPPIRTLAPDIRVPAKLDKALRKATIQDPKKRTQTAEELRRELYELVKPRHTGRNIAITLIALAVAGGVGYYVWQDQQDQAMKNWVRPTVVFADETVNMQSDTVKRAGTQETIELSGTGEVGAKLNLSVTGDNDKVLIFKNNITVDQEGNWSAQIDTRDLPVDIDQSQTFRILLSYPENDQIVQDGERYVLINNEFADIALKFQSEPGVASTSQEIIIGGTRQANAAITVYVRDEERNTIIEDTVPASAGTEWDYSFNTSVLPVADELARFTISARYVDTNRSAPNTLTLNVQPALKPLTMTYEGEDIIRDNGATIWLSGTASKNQSVSVLVTDMESGVNVVEKNTKTNDSGSWSVSFQAMELGVQEDETKNFAIAVQYIDDPDIDMEGGYLQLQVAIPLNMVTPTISASVGSGAPSSRILITGLDTEFSFSGTAARNQRVVLYMDNEIFSSAQAAADGTWSVGPYRPSDIGAGEGTHETREVYVAYETDTNNRSAGVAALVIQIDKTLLIPTIEFQTTGDTETEFLSSGTIHVQGLATPENRIVVRIQDESGRFTRMPNADVAEDGSWGVDFDLSTLGLNVGESMTCTLEAYYQANPDITSERTLRMTVSNPAFAVPTLTFADGATGDRTIGKDDDVALRVSGAEPGQEMQLLMNAQTAQTAATDANGNAEFLLTAAEMAGKNSLSVNVRYTTQMGVNSDYLNITVDREAQAIIATGAINEEDTSFSGNGEPGATIRIYDAEELIAESQIAADGSFQLEWSAGRTLTSVRLEEIDAFGNTAGKTLEVTEAVRLPIQITRPANYYIYGPNNRDVEFTGAATPGKRIKITVGETDTIVTSDIESGDWSTILTLPELKPSGTATVQVAYEDGKLEPISVALTADFATDEPRLNGDMLTQDTTVVGVILERGGKARVNGGSWVTDEANSGQVSIAVSGLDPQAGITVDVEDIYGNTSSASFAVTWVSNKVEGWIREPSTERTLTGADTMDITAYVIAGEAADISSRTLEVHPSEGFSENSPDSGAVVTMRLNDGIVGGELQMIAKQLNADAEEMTQGWKLQFRGFSPQSNGLAEGDYVLALFANVNGQRRYISQVGFTYEEIPDVAYYPAQDGDGWRIEVDSPQDAYNPNSVWISGYYYHDDSSTDLAEMTFTFYEDVNLQNAIGSVTVTPATYSRVNDLNKVSFSVTNTETTDRRGNVTISNSAGLILLCKYPLPKGEKIDGTRTVYAKLTSDNNPDIAIGPIRINLTNDAAATTVKNIRKQVEEQ